MLEARLLEDLSGLGLDAVDAVDDAVDSVHHRHHLVEERELFLLVSELIVDEVREIERDFGIRELLEIILGILLGDLLDLLLLLQQLLRMLLDLLLKESVAVC